MRAPMTPPHERAGKPRNAHCCLCGELRRPTQQPVESFGNNCDLVRVADHRHLQPERWEDSGGHLIVSVGMWRNGGTDYGHTHICDGCILVGLKHAKTFVDEALAALERETPNDQDQ